MRTLTSLIWTGVLTASLLMLSGCNDPEVQVYDVSKEANTATRNLAQSALPPADAAQPDWTPASAWEVLAPNQIRKGNYRVSDEHGTAEITVTSFPGDTGGLLANVNRWLGQAGLSPIGANDLDPITKFQELDNSVTATLVDLKSTSETPESTRIVAAIVPYAGQSWFFKMSGPHDTVESQVPAFEEMVADISFDSVSQMTANPPAAQDNEIAFRAPEGWTPSAGSSVRVASYAIEKEGSPPADFSIISFPGDTGGVVANVNRWRRQIGLEDWTEQEVRNASQTLTSDYGHSFRIFDLKGDATVTNERILVAILMHGGESWFFKLRGEPFLVETQNNKFRSLLLSVHFDHEGHSH